jgi:hypothetical protein
MSQDTQKQLLKMLGSIDYHSRRTDLPSESWPVALSTSIKTQKVRRTSGSDAASCRCCGLAFFLTRSLLEWDVPPVAQLLTDTAMSIKIITENGRSRPSFTCDKCGKPIPLSEGTILWDSEPEKSLKDGSQDGIVACHHCRPSFKKVFSQSLDQGLIFLLAKAGWLDAAFKPSNKLEEAAKAAYRLGQF